MTLQLCNDTWIVRQASKYRSNIIFYCRHKLLESWRLFLAVEAWHLIQKEFLLLQSQPQACYKFGKWWMANKCWVASTRAQMYVNQIQLLFYFAFFYCIRFYIGRLAFWSRHKIFLSAFFSLEASSAIDCFRPFPGVPGDRLPIGNLLVSWWRWSCCSKPVQRSQHF